eukprot:gene18560-6011_t
MYTGVSIGSTPPPPGAYIGKLFSDTTPLDARVDIRSTIPEKGNLPDKLSTQVERLRTMSPDPNMPKRQIKAKSPCQMYKVPRNWEDDSSVLSSSKQSLIRHIPQKQNRLEFSPREDDFIFQQAQKKMNKRLYKMANADPTYFKSTAAWDIRMKEAHKGAKFPTKPGETKRDLPTPPLTNPYHLKSQPAEVIPDSAVH